MGKENVNHMGLCEFVFVNGGGESKVLIRLSLVKQATELAEYTAKIALLEEARKRKESEVEEWQHRVRISFP